MPWNDNTEDNVKNGVAVLKRLGLMPFTFECEYLNDICEGKCVGYPEECEDLTYSELSYDDLHFVPVAFWNRILFGLANNPRKANEAPLVATAKKFHKLLQSMKLVKEVKVKCSEVLVRVYNGVRFDTMKGETKWTLMKKKQSSKRRKPSTV